MEESKHPFTVIRGGGSTGAQRTQSGLDANTDQSPPLPPGISDPQEIEIWKYICQQLTAAGIPHLAFGLAGAVVCNVYSEWLTARQILDGVKEKNGGTYIVTLKNGYEQPHQSFYVVEKLRRELLQWLPECCLTIPAYATTKSKIGDAGQQNDLFDSLVGHANADRASYAKR